MAKINLNAWRELVTRIFEPFAATRNVTPDWLVNPETNRKLKLDWLFPEIGVAVKFEGLKAIRQRRRLSLEEELQAKQRESARQAVCEAHGISLATLNLSTNDFSEVFSALEIAMSRATRRLAQNPAVAPDEKAALLEKLSRARGLVREYSRTVRSNRELDNFSALWHDRQFMEADAAASGASAGEPAPELQPGMRVEHTHFGEGVVESVSGGDDAMVTIDFVEAGKRTFMLALLGDKIVIMT